jgi:hypothetical protein
MAGLGYKSFSSGEVLTAANLQGYAVDQSIMVFPTAADRTTALPVPSQGMTSWLNDTGVMETYYELYNVSTNPGGREVAGWYGTSRTTGLLPVAPTSVAFAGTSATANSLGAVTFTAITSLSLNGVFTSAFRNYHLIFNLPTATATASASFRLRASGVDLSSNSYQTAQLFIRDSGVTQLNTGTTANGVSIGTTLNASNRANFAKMEIYSPQVAVGTSMQTYFSSSDATSGIMAVGGSMITLTNQYDGFTLFVGTGSLTGVVSVYGFND